MSALHIVSGLLALAGLSLPSARAQLPASRPALRSLPKTAPAAAPTTKATEMVDPMSGIVHSESLASGVPLGGIGAGTFQLLTDGTIAQAAIANNWNHPLQKAPGCFAAIWTRTQTRTTARVLALTSAYQLPTAARLDYEGLFPQAMLAFPDPALPVQTSLLAFSPLVPFDLKNSSFPAAAYVLRLKNPAATPIEISVALSWESLLPDDAADNAANGQGTRGTAEVIPSSAGFFGVRFTGSGKGDAAGAAMALMTYPPRPQAVVSTALWDANTEGHPPAWWEKFARDGSVSSEEVVLSEEHKSDARPFQPQPQTLPRPAAVVAARMTLKPGESVDLPFSVSWFLPHLATPGGEDVGHYYEVAFASAEEAGRQLLEDWTSLYGLTEEWQKRLLFSNLPRWSARRIINSVAPLTANTVHTRDGRFAFLGTVGGAEKPSQSAAKLQHANAQGSAAPGSSEANGADVTASSSESSAEKGLNAEREETRAHQTAQALLLTFFPQLAAQELTQFAATQGSDGFIVAPVSGDLDSRLGPPAARHAPLIPDAGGFFIASKNSKTTRAAKPTANALPVVVPPPSALPPMIRAITPLPALAPLDATAGYVLAMTRLTLWAGDPDFLHKNFAHVQQAIHALLSLERTMEAGKPLTSSTLSLWLAAVRAGQKMAVLAHEEALAGECEAAARRVNAQWEAHYWNGEFYADSAYILATPPEPPTKAPEIMPQRPVALPVPAALCAVDQLWGLWLAYQLDLGPLTIPDHLSHALQSIQQRNDHYKDPYNDRSRVVAGAPPAVSDWPSALVRVDGKPLPEASAADCLLPASLLADAALSVWQEQPETGLALLLRLESVRNTTARSPWQYPARIKNIPGETTSPQASLAVAADWNLLGALEGFALNIYDENGNMALTPHIPGTWRTFSAPIFAPTFWGRMEFRPAVHGGTTTFRLDRLIGFVVTPGNALLKNKAVLTLKTLRVLGPPRRENNTRPLQITAHVSQGEKPIGCTATLDSGGFVTLTFDSLLKMTAGDRLEVDIHSSSD